MAGLDPALKIRLEAQDAKFKRELDKAHQRITRIGKTSQRTAYQVKRSFRGMGSVVKTFATQVMGLLTAAALHQGIARLSTLIGEVVADLDNIGKTADALGFTTDALQELRYGFEAAGVSITATDKSLRRFQQAIGDADAGSVTYERHFQTMGVAIRDMNNNLKPTEQLLNEVADALSRTGDEALRQLMVRDLFGRSGSSLLVAFKGGAEGVKQLRHEVVKAGAVVEEEIVRRAEEFQTKWDLAGRVVDANMGDIVNSTLELKDALVEVKMWSSGVLADFLNIFTAIENKPMHRLTEDLEAVNAKIKVLQELMKDKKPIDDFFGVVPDAHGLETLLQQQAKLQKQITERLEERKAAEQAASEAARERIKTEASLREMELKRMEEEREAARLEAEIAARQEGYRQRLLTDEERFTDAVAQLREDRINGLITEMDYFKLYHKLAKEYWDKTKETMKESEEFHKKQAQMIESIKQSFETNFGSITDIVEGGSEAVKQSIKNMVKAIIDEIWKLVIIQPIAGAIANAIGGFIFSGAGSGGLSQGSAGVHTSGSTPATNYVGPGGSGSASVPAPANVAAAVPAYSPSPATARTGVTVNQHISFNTDLAAVDQRIHAQMPTMVELTKNAVQDANTRSFSRYT